MENNWTLVHNKFISLKLQGSPAPFFKKHLELDCKYWSRSLLCSACALRDVHSVSLVLKQCWPGKPGHAAEFAAVVEVPGCSLESTKISAETHFCSHPRWALTSLLLLKCSNTPGFHYNSDHGKLGGIWTRAANWEIPRSCMCV